MYLLRSAGTTTLSINSATSGLTRRVTLSKRIAAVADSSALGGGAGAAEWCSFGDTKVYLGSSASKSKIEGATEATVEPTRDLVSKIRGVTYDAMIL
jgi:hypothetical protein